MRLPPRSTLLLTICLCAVAACSFAPDYEPPSVPKASAYKEVSDWVPAAPSDALSRGAWWSIFSDPTLNMLENDLDDANQNLKIALAQYDEAHAAAAAARAAYFPQITGSSGATRNTLSTAAANVSPRTSFYDFTFGADMSYEIDLWGRVRNTVAAAEDQAQANAADLAGVRLSLQAELASDYFALRGDDEAQVILDRTVVEDSKALELTQARYNGGVAPEQDVDQAQTQVENAKTQATDMRLQRAQLEHAIAILTGRAPSGFGLAPAPQLAHLPGLSPGVPSTLLERRPDIASAERRTAAANAEIGVARAAYFPAFTLTGSVGFESASSINWLNAPANFWSIGPTAAMTLFDGGNISALNDEARAAYNEAVAAYRQTVLNAYQEVEDNLSALHHLADETVTQANARDAANRSLAQATNRYAQGATNYLDVVTAQNLALQAELGVTTIVTRRLTASVLLIRALGGGWQKDDIDEVPVGSQLSP